MKEKPKSGLVRYSRHVSIKFENGKHLKFDKKRVSFPIGVTPPEIEAGLKGFWKTTTRPTSVKPAGYIRSYRKVG